MKKTILLGLTACLLVATAMSCKKNKDKNGCGETALKVSTIPVDGTVDPPAPGTSFPLVVNITDGMPSAGVSISVTARKDSTNATPFFTETRDNVTMSSATFNITNAPVGSSSIVETVVTSKSCSSNQWKGSYRFSAK
jgi:hypothetical protein